MMSEFQVALIGLGVLLVVAVWGFNLWQERKLRRQVGAMVPAAADVLMAGQPADTPSGRAEPTMAERAAGAEPFIDDADAAPAAASDYVPDNVATSAPLHAAHHAAVSSASTFSDATETRLVATAHRGGESVAMALPSDWADAAFDCLLRIEFVDAVPEAQVWADKATLLGGIDKPLQWLGLDAHTARWRTLQPQDAGAVTQLALALQLTDRRGPVDDKTLTAFLGGAHRLAQKFSGLVELPEQAPVLQRANQLDAFCADVDLQLSLLVVPRSGSLDGMVGSRLSPVLAAAALREEGERFVALDNAGAVRFGLTCRDATATPQTRLDNLALAAIEFSFDVPRVADGAATFEQMLALANRCAEALGGQLADAHKHALPSAKLAAIRTRIVDVQARMAGAGMSAGGALALRLFA
jgi:hypothetical protein